MLTSNEKHTLEVLWEHCPEENDFDGGDGFGFGLLDESEALDISHAGGEFQELTCEVLGDFWNE